MGIQIKLDEKNNIKGLSLDECYLTVSHINILPKDNIAHVTVQYYSSHIQYKNKKESLGNFIQVSIPLTRNTETNDIDSIITQVYKAISDLDIVANPTAC